MSDEESQTIDRLSIRRPPSRSPLMYQSWTNLLFIHWPVSDESIRRLVPDRLALDTYDGSAWIGLTPFKARGTRVRFTPSIPYVSTYHELNVRTYVHYGGVPGVYFLSLDADSIAAVLAARTMFHLPYYWADMQLEHQGDAFLYTATRHSSAGSAQFRALWSPGEKLDSARPGTRAYFLTERYCLYTTYGDRLYRARIHHEPWPLQEAELSNCHSTYLDSHGLEICRREPVVHFSEGVRAKIWALEEM